MTTTRPYSTPHPPHALPADRLRARRRDHRPGAVRVRHAVAALRDLPRAVGLLARSSSRSSTPRTRSACSPRCCWPGACPTRSAAGRCCSAALGTLMVATVLFMLADSVVWLFVARGVQGLATGLALGAASAALLDLHPRRDPAGVGLTNGVVSAGGMGLGVLVSAAFVEFAARAARAAVRRAVRRSSRSRSPARWRMPEPVAERSRLRLTPQRPERPGRGPPAVPARRARRASPRGRSAACSCRSARSSRRPLPHDQPPRGRHRRVRAGRLGRGRADRCSAARRRGPAPPPGRSRCPAACC